MTINANQLKAFRESKGLSQEKFAKLIGSHGATIANIENGRVGVGPKMLDRYRKAGFRPVGRPPSGIQIPSGKTDVDAVLLAEKVLKQQAPHLLATADPEIAILRPIGTWIDHLSGKVDKTMQRLEVLERGQDIIAEHMRDLQKMVTAQGDMMEKGFRTLMEPPPDDPDLRSTDGQAPGNSS